jgi:hypothetical protein
MRTLVRYLKDTRDWDQLRAYEVECPLCEKEIGIYFDPERDDYLLMGFDCRYCHTPYTTLFSDQIMH